MDEKIVKLAIIRNNVEPCPYGLSIPSACKIAGECVRRMTPLGPVEDKEDAANSNEELLNLQADGTRCVFAEQIMDNAVNCNFGTTTAGVDSPALIGSPFYSRQYNQVAFDGLYSYPQGFYGDGNISRNLYYGILSLQSDESENIKKTGK